MKKVIVLLGVLIVVLSAVITGIFVLVNNKRESDDIVIDTLVDNPTAEPVTTMPPESLFDSANASILPDEFSGVESNYEDYINEVETLAHAKYDGVLPEVKVRYVETVDTGILNHVFEIENTDVIINVSVSTEGAYEILDPANRYGSDYAIVWFEVEPSDRMGVYDYLYDVTSVGTYIFDSNEVLTNVETKETFDYGLYARGESGTTASSTGNSGAN